MKIIKILGITLLSFTCLSQVNAQKVSSKAEAKIAEAEEINKEYIRDVKTLRTYFISSEIPSTFPKYDSSLDKNGNQTLVINWLDVPENYALLSQTGIEKVEISKAKKAKENASKK